MARISFSALVEEITGKLAGSVFQDSYGGLQVRTRVTPRNPQTKYQQLRRGEFGFLSASWRNLTSLQRQTFIDAASTAPAALNLFLQANVNLTLIEEPTIDSYVPSSDPGSMAIEFIEATPTSMEIRATGSPTTVPAGTKLLLQVTFLKPKTRIFTNPSMYSPVISFDEGTDLSVPTDILSEWQSRYGVMLPDKRVCLKSALINKSNGLRGADTINCTITEEMAKYTPLVQFNSTESNTGTGSVDLAQFNIIANTLAADGDRLIIRYAGTSNSAGGNNQVIPSFFGTGVAFTSFGSNQTFQVEIIIQRTDSDTIEYTATLLKGGSTFQQSQSAQNTVDFTIDNATALGTVSPASSSLNMKMGSIDLIKA